MLKDQRLAGRPQAARQSNPIEQYYRTMRQFLSTHERLMGAYLSTPFNHPDPVTANAVQARQPPDAETQIGSVASGGNSPTSPPVSAEPLSTDDSRSSHVPIITALSSPEMRATQFTTVMATEPTLVSGSVADAAPYDVRMVAETARVGAVQLASNEQKTSRPYLPRFVIRAKAEPLGSGSIGPLPSGVYVITADGLGVAEALAERLENSGVRPCLVPRAILNDEKEVGRWVSVEATHEPIRAVIHLAPLDALSLTDDMSLVDWRDRMGTDVKALFALLRHTAYDLKRGGRVISVSGMGGLFGREARNDASLPLPFPGGGGNVGVVRSLAREWSDCRSKAIDVDPTESAPVLSDHIYSELATPAGRSEIGYPAGIRTIFRTEPATLQPIPIDNRTPTEDWVVLVVGGAMGFAAQCLEEVAAKGPRLVLVCDKPSFGGLSPQNGEVADAQPSGEMAEVCDRYSKTGAKVDYRIADLQNEDAVRDLITSLYQQYGRLDAVFFGLGVADGEALEHLSPERISVVFDARVDGAFLVCRHLRSETLKVLTFFNSTAGRYGHSKQTDVAAANETLSRYASVLQNRFGPDVRVSVINWQPWCDVAFGVGDPASAIKRDFQEQGILLVRPDEARDLVMRDMLYAPAGFVEVVAGHYAWEYAEAEGRADVKTGQGENRSIGSFPFLHNAVVLASDAGARTLRKTIDLVSDPYLDHHRIPDVPLLAFVCAAEHMAEAVEALGFPGRVSELRDIRRVHGVILNETERTIDIKAQKGPTAQTVKVEIWLTGEDRLAYSALVVLGDIPRGSIGPPVKKDAPTAAPFDVSEGYARWINHGPVFQTLTDIVTFSEQQLIVRIKPAHPRVFCPVAVDTQWLFDPSVVDAVAQVVCMWSRELQDKSTLATSMGRLQRFATGPHTGELTAVIDFQCKVGDPLVACDFSVLDAEGVLQIRGENFVSVANADSNRLCIPYGYAPARYA